MFSQDHWRLEGHTCPKKDEATQQDQRVPICPLCDKPVPVKKGENPNVRMEQHIAAGCPEPATTTSKPIYTNSCNAKGCKNRSAIPIICQKCRLNYCLKHRLEGDHSCSSNSNSGNGKSNGNSHGANGSASKSSAPAHGSSSHHNNWAHKAGNAVKARSAAAAAAATSRQNQNNQSRPSNGSSGKKDKDKCVIS
ncbi:zinc finger, AN1-type domain [Podila minutissima]|uniref:Zinc finger, AN1-type domain n=1 Tax=Podila minutissima TaxID=64525 RepID=A0A9P5VM16_9FUNG|nr:zinc finger, AN1-type domain [Podila minutissima]